MLSLCHRYIRLRRRVQGIINRLSEANLDPLCTELVGLFDTNSAGMVNKALTTALMTIASTDSQVGGQCAFGAFSRTLGAMCISAAPTPACCILTHAGCDVHQCSPTPACIGIPSHVFGQGERVVHVRTLGDYPFGPPPLPFLPFASPSHRPPPLPTMQVLRPLVMVFAALVAALHIRVDLAVSANALELVVRR